MNEEEATKLTLLEELHLAAVNSVEYLMDLTQQQKTLDSKMRDAIHAQSITTDAYYNEWKRSRPRNNFIDAVLGTNDGS